MVINVLLAGGILFYALWVLGKKMKDIKNGKCCCDCSCCQGRCGKNKTSSVQTERSGI